MLLHDRKFVRIQMTRLIENGLRNGDLPCVMENRWFTWGESTQLIKAHCLQYPASARPADHLSAVRLDLPMVDVAHLGTPAIVNPKDPANVGGPNNCLYIVQLQGTTFTPVANLDPVCGAVIPGKVESP